MDAVFDVAPVIPVGEFVPVDDVSSRRAGGCAWRCGQRVGHRRAFGARPSNRFRQGSAHYSRGGSFGTDVDVGRDAWPGGPRRAAGHSAKRVGRSRQLAVRVRHRRDSVNRARPRSSRRDNRSARRAQRFGDQSYPGPSAHNRTTRSGVGRSSEFRRRSGWANGSDNRRGRLGSPEGGHRPRHHGMGRDPVGLVVVARRSNGRLRDLRRGTYDRRTIGRGRFRRIAHGRRQRCGRGRPVDPQDPMVAPNDIDRGARMDGG